MTITTRGVAIFTGVVLGGFSVIGLLIDPEGSWAQNYLISTWLPPIVLWPVTVLVCVFDRDIPRQVRAQLRVLSVSYSGLGLYAFVSGRWWWDVSGRSTHENYAGLAMLVVMAIHAAVFVLGGLALVVFPKARTAAVHMWLGYAVLLASWLIGAMTTPN